MTANTLARDVQAREAPQLNRPSSGPTGGAANEAGAAYRRGVAAFFVAHGLNGIPVEGLPIGVADAVVEGVALETEFAVDDILVLLRRARLFIQAKRTLSFGRPMQEVAKQWLHAIRDPAFRPSEDLVAVASGELSKSARALALALDRARVGATTFSTDERTAFSLLRKVLKSAGASPDEVELVIRHAVVLPLQVETPGQEDSERGRLLLDGHVVRKGEGTKAWRELMSLAGDAARLRLGYPIAAWLDELGKRGIPLTADHAASHAAHLTRRAQAVARYRQHLRDRGQRVDLTSIGLAIPPIALSDMDADIPVRRLGANERDEADLLWAFRRHGRVVLTGLPGGGKSICMAATAAEWASHEDWSLPIAISLKKVGEREQFRKKPLREQLLDAAVEALDSNDRPLVHEALAAALATGHVVLFLDGLDEAADRSLLLASDIGQLLKDIHHDTDVLLATRDVAYADTGILGFYDLRIGSPRDPSRCITAVLGAIAAQREIPDADVWVASRVEWVNRSIKFDSQLGETPLLPVLLAALAADRNNDELPRTRALILERVIEDVVRRGEARREIQISGLPEGQHVEAVLETFPRIAVALTKAGGSLPRRQLADQLALYLQTEWGLPPAGARATATQILVFWDESGIFVAGGGEKVVTPRVRLFLEMGTALDAASRPDEAREWVDAVAERPDMRETLLLAAGRSKAIADELIRRACRATSESDDALAVVAAQALGQGGSATEARVFELISRLQLLLRFGDEESWKVFRHLAALSIPADLADSILSVMNESFPSEYTAVAKAYASVNWKWDPSRLEEHLEQALQIDSLPRLGRRKPKSGIDLDSLDNRIFMTVKETAAAVLLPKRPDLAPAVAQAIEGASFATADALIQLLRDNGHQDLATEASDRVFKSAEFYEQIVRGAEKTRDDVAKFLATLASLPAPAALTLSQERRLQELASYVETLDLNNISAWMRGDTWRPLQKQFVHLVAALGGFDEAILAAEAIALQREIKTDSGSQAAFFSLFSVAPEADLTNWGAVADSDAARTLLIRVLHGPSGAAWVAAGALATHPESQKAAEAIEVVLVALPHRCVLPATWAYLKLVSDVDKAADDLAHSSSASIREAVARVIPPIQDGRPTALSTLLVSDPVRQVRLGVLERIKGERPTPDVLAFLETVRSSKDPPFKCYRCDTNNLAPSDSCSSCHIVTNRPSQEAVRILANLRKAETQQISQSN